jgi:hypothetical protein
MPCHGLLSYKPARLVQSGAVYLSNCRGSLHSKTLDQTYLYHSRHWGSAASYVALTRHRESASLFVGRDTAGNLDELAR